MVIPNDLYQTIYEFIDVFYSKIIKYYIITPHGHILYKKIQFAKWNWRTWKKDTHQYWHQNRNSAFPTPCFSIVLKHSKAGYAYPRTNLQS